MKSKEEVIQSAYDGEKYDWDENGWLTYGVDENSEFGYEPFGDYETRNHVDGVYEWRPKSLQGIENNNGWISINSESDLPSEKGAYWVACRNHIYENPRTQEEIQFDYKVDSTFYTHYQKINKPLPPLHK